MPAAPAAAVGTLNSVMLPAVVMRPILLALGSVNQSAPSGPAVMKNGVEPAASENSVNVPDGVTRPILEGVCSANQTLPSEPAARLWVNELAVGMTKFDSRTPAVDTRSMLLLVLFVTPEHVVRAVDQQIS